MSTAEVVPVSSIRGPVEIVQVPLAQLRPSKTNPRHEESVDQDFVDDIKARGVQVPILARPIQGAPGFEIVYGHRRFYGAKRAKRDAIPAEIRKLNDDEALELQAIENAQREDLHPLEEAEQFGLLFGRALERVKDKGLALDAVAAKIHKPVRHIAMRLQLNHLLESVKQAFHKGLILLGHAEEIARLEPADQKRAMEFALQDVEVQSGADRGYQRMKTKGVSVDSLKAWIKLNVMLDLSKAPFDVADATLSSKYGACINCPHRTGANKNLFGDIGQGDFCTVPEDYYHKRNVTIDRAVAAMSKERGGVKLLRVGIGNHYYNKPK